MAILDDHYPEKLKSTFWTKIYIVKIPLNVKIVQQDLLHRKQLLSEVQKGGILILVEKFLEDATFNAMVVVTFIQIDNGNTVVSKHKTQYLLAWK